MRKNDLIIMLSKNGFIEYNEVYDKLEENKVEVIDKDIYIYTDQKRIIVIKPYESFKSAYFSYEDTQNKIKAIIEVINKRYKKNLYFFLCVNELLKEKHIKVINLIEKDQYICKKYVIVNEDDFKRISFLNSSYTNSENANYNEIKVNEIFIKLIDKYCENKNSITYAQNYLYKSRISFEDEE